MANNLEKLPVNASEALDNLKRRYSDLRTSVTNINSLPEPLYRMRNDQNALNRRKYIYRVNSVYVRLQGCKMLHLGFRSYLSSIQPMINGLVPAKVRQFIRKKQRHM